MFQQQNEAFTATKIAAWQEKASSEQERWLLFQVQYAFPVAGKPDMGHG
jgi:hypothetical protein